MKDIKKYHVVEKECVACETTHILVVNETNYKAWRGGQGYIQDMLPELNAGERELLISGVCNDCFMKIFSDEEE